MHTTLARIFSVDTKNIDGGPRYGIAHDAPPHRRVGPKCLAHSALVPDFSDQNMVTL